MSNKFASALKSKKEGTAPETAEQGAEAANPHSRPSRTGTKHVGGHFSPEVSKQLRRIALDEDSSVQKLLAEAIDMIFHSRKLPTIASKQAE